MPASQGCTSNWCAVVQWTDCASRPARRFRCRHSRPG